MKRWILLLVAAAAAPSLSSPAHGAEKKSHDLDSALLTAVKRVAVVSVYGPATFTEGLREKIDLQPLVNGAETIVGAGLRQAGFDVVPAEETKTAVKAAFAPAYADAYVEEYKRANRRASDADVQKIRAGLDEGGLQFAPRGLVAVSANTSFAFGTDLAFPPWALKFTVDGQPVGANLKPPAHSAPALAGLAAVAKALNADAVLVVRTRPGTATVAPPDVQKAGSGKALGVLPSISNLGQQMKALRAGKYGANILEVTMLGRHGERLFADQVVGRSKEDEGNATVALQVSRGVGQDKALALMKEALDAAMATALLHLTGKELAAGTPGLGLESLALPAAATTAPAQSGTGIAGRYVLTAVKAKPLPAKKDDQTIFHSGLLVLNSDGTYANDTVWSGVAKIFGAEKPTGEKTNAVKGRYTINGRTLALAPEGGMLVQMTAPKNGEIAGDTLTLFPGAFVYVREAAGQPPAAAK